MQLWNKLSCHSQTASKEIRSMIMVRRLHSGSGVHIRRSGRPTNPTGSEKLYQFSNSETVTGKEKNAFQIYSSCSKIQDKVEGMVSLLF